MHVKVAVVARGRNVKKRHQHFAWVPNAVLDLDTTFRIIKG